MISDAALQEFKQVWLTEFGEEIPDEIAIGQAVNLLTLFDAIYRPIKQEWVNEYENEQTITENQPSSATL
jgi:hypothetical protein